MHELSPPEQAFALDLTKLRAPDITVWSEGILLGCGALKELSPTHGEIKSMRTPLAARGKGAGRAVLEHTISVARQRGYTRLSLETGTHPALEPAHNLYRSQRFIESSPFSSYSLNPHNVFMAFDLAVVRLCPAESFTLSRSDIICHA